MNRAGFRTVVASLLTAAALAALLIGWFGAGWAGVRAEERTLDRSAHDDGERLARSLAAALDGRLEELRRSEARRPYFHYQSLFHDPRGAAEGLAVVPSPLASGPDDALVRGHFQIDGKGQVSMPTLNDELPELSQPGVVEANRVLRTALAAASSSLEVAGDPGAPPVVAVAAIDAPETIDAKAPPRKQRKSAPVPTKVVVEVDPEVYSQNAVSTDIYKQTRKAPLLTVPQQAVVPPVQQQAVPRSRPVQQQVVPRSPPAAPPVAITIAPPEWRAATLAGAPSLVLVRRVDTPDGALTQGLVIDRDAVVDWLTERAEDRTVALEVAGRGGAERAIAPLAVGAWAVAIDLGQARLRAASDGAALRRGFLMRLVPIALLAAACGVLVVLLVARAERLARQRASFAAAAAHELRTPLAGLQLYGDMLADGLGDPSRQRDYARRLAEEASRLGRVVSNVLGFSQLERGNLSVHAAPRPIAAIVDAAVERARPALERAGAVVTVGDLGPDLVARLDEDAVLRILGNLIDNAEKYGRGGADRTVSITASRRDGAVEIAVADAGPGIDDRHRRRLFRPFSRAVGADAPAGLGLGLALSRSLARAMGGDLVHRPTPGGGATFVLVLAAG